MHVLAMARARVLLSVYKIQLNHYSKPKNMLANGANSIFMDQIEFNLFSANAISRECQKYDVTLRVVY